MKCLQKRPVGLALTLSILLGLIAFMASTAQANWKTKGAELKVDEALGVKTHVETAFEVPAQNLSVLCSTVASEGLKLLASSGKAEGKIKFTSCKTWQSGKESPGCKPTEPIIMGIVITLILHGGDVYLLYTSLGGKEELGKIEFNPAKCALPEENEVTGSFVDECLSSSLKSGIKLCTAEEAVHIVRQAPEALFPGDKLVLGTNLLLLTGQWELYLAVTAAQWSGII
jgi:hypothetical protein